MPELSPSLHFFQEIELNFFWIATIKCILIKSKKLSWAFSCLEFVTFYKIISSIFLLIIFVCKALSVVTKHSYFYCVLVWIVTFCKLHSHSVSFLFDAVLTCSPVPKHCVCSRVPVRSAPEQAALCWSGKLFGMGKTPMSFMGLLWVILLKFKGTRSVSQLHWN